MLQVGRRTSAHALSLPEGVKGTSLGGAGGTVGVFSALSAPS